MNVLVHLVLLKDSIPRLVIRTTQLSTNSELIGSWKKKIQNERERMLAGISIDGNKRPPKLKRYAPVGLAARALMGQNKYTYERTSQSQAFPRALSSFKLDMVYSGSVVFREVGRCVPSTFASCAGATQDVPRPSSPRRRRMAD